MKALVIRFLLKCAAVLDAFLVKCADVLVELMLRIRGIVGEKEFDRAMQKFGFYLGIAIFIVLLIVVSVMVLSIWSWLDLGPVCMSGSGEPECQ